MYSVDNENPLVQHRCRWPCWQPPQYRDWYTPWVGGKGGNFGWLGGGCVTGNQHCGHPVCSSRQLPTHFSFPSFFGFFYISFQYVSSVQKIELYNTMVVECRKGLIGNSDLADNQLDHNLRGILSSRALLCGSDLDIKYKYFIFNRCILLKKSIHSKLSNEVLDHVTFFKRSSPHSLKCGPK